MKSSFFFILMLGAAIIFFGCSENQPTSPDLQQNDQVTTSLAKKPAPNLIGEMELTFNLDWAGELDVPVWEGTVFFEDYVDFGDEGNFGIRFFHLSPFKEYSQASPFEEYFEIYVEGGDSDDYEDDVIYLGGPDAGVTTTANKPPEPCKYRMNGKIDVANTPFEGWMGRHVHMSGEITWQVLETPDGPVVAPATAPGILRIN